MAKHNKVNKNIYLDKTVIEILANAQSDMPISSEIKNRMRRKMKTNISEEPGFQTIKQQDGVWIEAMPGAQYKILHNGKQSDGLLSYLIKLEAGFEMQGHEHPFDEECLMLTGDLTLGEIELNQGDFHFAKAGMTHGRLFTKTGCTAYIRGALPV